MKKVIVNVLILVFLMSGAYAQLPQQNNQAVRGGQKSEVCDEDKVHSSRMEKLLPDLTDVQKAKLKEIAVEFKVKREPIKQQLVEKEEVLNKMIDDPSASKELINKKIDEISVLKANLHKLRFEQKMRCDVVLTKEQQEVLKAHKEEMRKRKGSMYHGETERMNK